MKEEGRRGDWEEGERKRRRESRGRSEGRKGEEREGGREGCSGKEARKEG